METEKAKLREKKIELKNARKELAEIDARVDSLGRDETNQRIWKVENQLSTLVASYANDDISLDTVLTLKAELRQLELRLQDTDDIIDVYRDLRKNVNAKIKKLEKEKTAAELDLLGAFKQVRVSELQERFSPEVYAIAAFQSLRGSLNYPQLLLQIFPSRGHDEFRPYQDAARKLIADLLSDDDDDTDDDSIN